jgi:polyisoprenoid-binding protein YceI
MQTTTLTSRKTKWVLDPAHSELGFKVRHMMISNVKGEFRKFNADVTTVNDDPSTAIVHAEVESDSIFTNDESRDKHLRSEDFFDVKTHDKILFESTSMKKITDDHYKLTGVLTMKEISREITLDVEFGGINKDPWGNQKAGFTIKGKINRKDWGLNWNALLETGGVLVSDEVRIHGDLQFLRKSNDY